MCLCARAPFLSNGPMNGEWTYECTQCQDAWPYSTVMDTMPRCMAIQQCGDITATVKSAQSSELVPPLSCLLFVLSAMPWIASLKVVTVQVLRFRVESLSIGCALIRDAAKVSLYRCSAN